MASLFILVFLIFSGCYGAFGARVIVPGAV